MGSGQGLLHCIVNALHDVCGGTCNQHYIYIFVHLNVSSALISTPCTSRQNCTHFCVIKDQGQSALEDSHGSLIIIF